MSTIVGTQHADRLHGTGQADLIEGRGGDDQIAGRRGDDTIDAGSGDDVIRWFTGDGSDRIDGGTGTDSAIFDAHLRPGTSYTLGGTAAGALALGWGGQGAATETLAHVEKVSLIAGNGDDSVTIGDLSHTGIDPDQGLSLTTGGGHDRVDAHAAGVGVSVEALHAASATLIGGALGDALFDSHGNDRLIGNAGDDFIDARGGDDVIDAGTGDDLIGIFRDHPTITTGQGSDTVEVEPYGPPLRAEITDFDPHRDRIELLYADKPFGVLDTNHDGKLDAADSTVQATAHGITVDVTQDAGGLSHHVTLTFDHLTSLPLDVFET